MDWTAKSPLGLSSPDFQPHIFFPYHSAWFNFQGFIQHSAEESDQPFWFLRDSPYLGIENLGVEKNLLAVEQERLLVSWLNMLFNLMGLRVWSCLWFTVRISLTGMVRLILKISGIIPWDGGPDWQKERKQVEHWHSRLYRGQCDQLLPVSARDFPAMMDCIPSNCELNTLFFKLLWLSTLL